MFREKIGNIRNTFLQSVDENIFFISKINKIKTILKVHKCFKKR